MACFITGDLEFELVPSRLPADGRQVPSKYVVIDFAVTGSAGDWHVTRASIGDRLLPDEFLTYLEDVVDPHEIDRALAETEAEAYDQARRVFAYASRGAD